MDHNSSFPALYSRSLGHDLKTHSETTIDWSIMPKTSLLARKRMQLRPWGLISVDNNVQTKSYIDILSPPPPFFVRCANKRLFRSVRLSNHTQLHLRQSMNPSICQDWTWPSAMCRENTCTLRFRVHVGLNPRCEAPLASHHSLEIHIPQLFKYQTSDQKIEHPSPKC